MPVTEKKKTLAFEQRQRQRTCKKKKKEQKPEGNIFEFTFKNKIRIYHFNI